MVKDDIFRRLILINRYHVTKKIKGSRFVYVFSDNHNALLDANCDL
jgi:hypothetical protein